jgi:hypothetical protein
LISGIVLLAGLLDDNSGLIILGGAGVLVALSETNGTAYRMRAGNGIDMFTAGHVSVGFNPFGNLSFDEGLKHPQPNVILQAKFKF